MRRLCFGLGFMVLGFGCCFLVFGLDGFLVVIAFVDL